MVQRAELPNSALLLRYQREGTHTDCYVLEVPDRVSHTDYVEAFYTTALFKTERWILAALVARPSTDAQARQLAAGELDRFAAWNVEARDENQLLMCDFQGRTRSWLMTAPGAMPGSTRLYFGSAVVPVIDRHTGESRLGAGYSALLGFHKLYSRALLRAASRRLGRRKTARP